MEVNCDLNALSGERIFRVENNLLPDRYILYSWNENRFRKIMTKIIDDLGEASSSARGLRKVITTAEKLKKSEDTVFILKDQKEQDVTGLIVGFLKIGRKRILVYDLQHRLVEKDAICVLDFYVHESMQREGYGKLLFDHMLRDQDIKPNKVAVHRPSEICLSFMKKHYHLSSLMHQPDNLVVFQEFFLKRRDMINLLNKSSHEIREDLRRVYEEARLAAEREEKLREKLLADSKSPAGRSRRDSEDQSGKKRIPWPPREASPLLFRS